MADPTAEAMGPERAPGRAGGPLIIVGFHSLDTYSGGSQRRTELVREVADLGASAVVCLGDVSDRQTDALSDQLRAPVHAVRLGRGSTPATLRRWIAEPTSWSDARRDFSDARRLVAELVAENSAELIWCAGLTEWNAVPPDLRSRVAIDLIDLPSTNAGQVLAADLQRLVRRVRHPRAAPASAVSTRVLLVELEAWIRSQRVERHVIGHAGLVTVASAVESASRAGVVSIANGVREPRDPTIGEPPATVPRLVFPAQFRYAPNADAAEWFVARVLPGLRERVPESEVVFAGGCAEPLVELGERYGVEVTGRLDDFADVYRDAQVVIVPVRYGSGTRIKILEAWAHGVPVVSTTKGAEGLPAVDGDNVLLADDPDAFVDACARAVTEPELAERIGSAGRAEYEKGWSWAHSRSELRKVLAGRIAQIRWDDGDPAPAG